MSSGNLVQGNLIGTDLTGSEDLGNASDGVSITDSPNNTIGGTSAGARNIISGNSPMGWKSTEALPLATWCSATTSAPMSPARLIWGTPKMVWLLSSLPTTPSVGERRAPGECSFRKQLRRSDRWRQGNRNAAGEKV
jgi:hypothetical protein